MAAPRDVFSPEVLAFFGADLCQEFLDGLEALQTSKAAAVAGLLHMGQLMADIRRSDGDLAAAQSLKASDTISVAEGFFLERAYLKHPDWLNPAAVDLTDPLVHDLLEVGSQTYARHCAAPPQQV